MGTWPSPLTPLDELTFTFVDVETTGLDPATGDRVCEIALLRVQENRELARFESLVHPQRPMHPGALAVHGITDAMLVGAPIFATLLPQIHALLQDAVLVAHNARFDMGFLRHEWQLAGHTFPFLAVASVREVLPHWSLVGFLSVLPLVGRDWAALAETRPARIRRRVVILSAVPLLGMTLFAAHARWGLFQKGGTTPIGLFGP